MARRIASTVASMAGAISCSNSERTMRTWVLTPGSITGIVTSVSDDSAFFASVHSRRSVEAAVITSGSAKSSPAHAAPRCARTCSNTASSKSIPPSDSRPSGRPASSKPPPSSWRTIVASKVPPPRS